MYPVFGMYPEAVYHFSQQAAAWCDYSAPSCAGRKPGEAIKVPGGLRMLLALEREGQPLSPAVLSKDNKLEGEGPYRVIVPQKVPSPPDQSSKRRIRPCCGLTGLIGITMPVRRPARSP